MKAIFTAVLVTLCMGAHSQRVVMASLSNFLSGKMIGKELFGYNGKTILARIPVAESFPHKDLVGISVDSILSKNRIPLKQRDLISVSYTELPVSVEDLPRADLYLWLKFGYIQKIALIIYVPKKAITP